jgi:class 3 adenylate cyclase
MDSTLELVLTTLKMDKAVILWLDSEKEKTFRIRWKMGYSKNQLEVLNSALLKDEILWEANQFLVNKSSRPDPNLAPLHEALILPYFLGIPLYRDEKVTGWLIAGREKEAQPFYPPLSGGDLFTFHALGVFLEAAVANILLYKDVEKANEKLERYNLELEKVVEMRTRDIAQRNRELKAEKQKSDELLLNILPENIAEELKTHGKAKARIYENVSVLFTDFVNFTHFTEVHSPEALVAEIDHCFRAFDTIATKYHLEKIKTIGDAYLCTGGIPGPEDQLEQVIRAAFEFRDFILDYNSKNRDSGKQLLNMRVGIHHGPVIAGVVGWKKFAFDIWGDTVNTAARIESHGVPGKVNVSETVFERMKDIFNFEYRGEIEVKNKGEISMYFIED